MGEVGKKRTNELLSVDWATHFLCHFLFTCFYFHFYSCMFVVHITLIRESLRMRITHCNSFLAPVPFYFSLILSTFSFAKLCSHFFNPFLSPPLLHHLFLFPNEKDFPISCYASFILLFIF